MKSPIQIPLIVLVACFIWVSASTTGAAQNEPDSWKIPYTAIGRGQIESVAWYPDNERIFVSTANDVWIYGLDLEIVAHLPNVSFAQLSPDGRYIAGVGADAATRIWDATTLEMLFDFYSPNLWLHDTRFMAWSPDSRYLAIIENCSIVACVNIRRSDDFGPIIPGSIRFPASSLVWSTQGGYLALFEHTTSVVKVVSMTDVSFQFTYYPQSVDQEPDFINWLDETTLLHYGTIDGDADRILTRVNILSGSVSAQYKQTTLSPTTDSGLDVEHGFGVRITSGDGILSDILPSRVEHIGIRTATWNSDSTLLALGTFDWNTTLEQELFVLDPYTDEFVRQIGGFTQAIEHIEWSPDDRYLFIADARQKIAIYDLSSEQIVAESAGHTVIGKQAAWRPLHEQIVVSDTLGNVNLWNSTSWEIEAAFTGHHYPVTFLSWNPPGTLFYAGGRHLYAVLNLPERGRLWNPDIPDEDPLPALTQYGMQEVLFYDWHPTEEQIAIFRGDILVWDTQADRFIQKMPVEPRSAEYYPQEIMWSSSGDYIAVLVLEGDIAGNLTVELSTGDVDVAGGEVLYGTARWSQADDALMMLRWGSGATKGAFASVYAVRANDEPNEQDRLPVAYRHLIRTTGAIIDRGVLSPFGTYAAVIDYNREAVIWASEAGSPVFILSNVANVVWSPDETRLIVQRTDGAIWLMEADGTILAELDRPRSFNGAGGEFVWSPEGDRLALVNAGYVLVWEVD